MKMRRLMIMLVMIWLVSAVQAEVIWWDGCSSYDQWSEGSAESEELENGVWGAISIVDNGGDTVAIPDADGKEIQLNSWWGSGDNYGTWADIWTTNSIGTIQTDKDYTLTVTAISWDDSLEPEDGQEVGIQPDYAGDQIWMSIYYLDAGGDPNVISEAYVWPTDTGDLATYNEYTTSFSTVGGANSELLDEDIYVWITTNGWWNNFAVSEVSVTDTAPLAEKASNPHPTDDEEDVPTKVVLSWDAAANTNVRHRLYFGTAAGGLSPQGSSLDYDVTKVLINDLVVINSGTEYIWRIDEFDTTTQHVETGDVWFFTTDFAPIIISQPSNVFANPDASMTVTATEYSGGTSNLFYQWYNSDGVLSDDDIISGSSATGVGSSTLTFTGASESYVDYYYCIVTDTSLGFSVTTDTALMEVARLYAQFTFEADTVEIIYEADPSEDWALVENVINGEQEGQYDWDTTYGGPVIFGPGHVGDQAITFEDLRDNPLGDDDDEWMWMDQSILDPVAANGGKQATIAMWAITENIDGHGLKKQPLFSVLTNDDWFVHLGAYCPTVGGEDKIRFEDQEGAEVVEWTMSDPNDLHKQWHHFAFTKNVDTGDMKIYVNGELKNTTNATLADIQTSDHVGAFLGAHTYYNESFTGSIDDFRLYNYALSDTEVAYIYNCPVPPQYDLDPDCVVDLKDLRVMAGLWIDQYDLSDLAGLGAEWHTGM